MRLPLIKPADIFNWHEIWAALDAVLECSPKLIDSIKTHLSKLKEQNKDISSNRFEED